MAKTNTKARPVGGDMTVYTALLVVTAIVLLGGIGVLWASNVSQLEAAGQMDGMPFTAVR
jgi:hypothetical protein